MVAQKQLLTYSIRYLTIALFPLYGSGLVQHGLAWPGFALALHSGFPLEGVSLTCLEPMTQQHTHFYCLYSF